MSVFPWLNNQIQQWQSVIETGKVPHAIMLTGSKGLGKQALAREMAHISLCENLQSNGVCNRCNGCHLFKAGNHTDFSVIKAEKAVIKVDQIRSLTKSVVLSSTRNQYRVVIIENVELMNRASANALLKTLEEPPAKVILILTTNEYGRILATIKSRCLKINIKQPSYHEIFTWLQSKQVFKDSDIHTSLMLSNGAPLEAERLLEKNELEVIYEMLTELDQLQQQKVNVLNVSKRWLANELLIYLPFIASYFLYHLRKFHGLTPNDHIQQYEDRYPNLEKYGSLSLDLVKQIYQLTHRCDTPLKKELLIEELLINWLNKLK